MGPLACAAGGTGSGAKPYGGGTPADAAAAAPVPSVSRNAGGAYTAPLLPAAPPASGVADHTVVAVVVARRATHRECAVRHLVCGPDSDVAGAAASTSVDLSRAANKVVVVVVGVGGGGGTMVR